MVTPHARSSLRSQQPSLVRFAHALLPARFACAPRLLASLAFLACCSLRSQPPLASSPAARYAARRLSCSLQLSLHRSPPLMLARSARRLTCSSRFVRRLLLAPLAASPAARFARRWPLRLLLASLADSPTGSARQLQHFLAGVVDDDGRRTAGFAELTRANVTDRKWVLLGGSESDPGSDPSCVFIVFST